MILIKDVFVNGKRQDILIEGNKIKKIGEVKKEELEDAEIIDGKNKIAIPGLINTHTHIPMTLFRGVADDLPLMEWLNNYIWPMEAKLNEEIVYWGTLLGCIEMIRSGTTTFNDMYFFLEGIAKAVDESGMRAVLAYGMIDLFDEEKRERELKNAEKYINYINSLNNSRIMPALGPHAPYTCSKELLVEVNNLAKKYGVPIHIHLNETLDEIKMVKEKTGMEPFVYLNSFGFFDGVRVIAAHCVHLTDEEIKIMKEKNINVSHNPISNLKLASGIAPIPKLLAEGINITLGTDGCGSNNNLNLFEEIKVSAILHKGYNLNPTVVKAEEAFNFATKNGAKALNIKAGEIKEGYLADIVLINLDKPYLYPKENILSHLVYAFNGFVDDVIIDGKIVMSNGKILTVDEEKVYEKAEEMYEILRS
ncbi:amidohydrolase [Methanocaldococcus sp. FS406-22]|uniref:multifunctional 5'-deoxyadenosine/S-adenosyl-L-homocysteine/5'- methylthioadenosine deaminase n=1 Tax=Methanocaldococcus sp. (strain FS406-22) TaxID=644281 RepID=UPI0001BF5401|nr:multifunctional 5'-deoxyadenosine/S-adenosyl-L-homocysteine/5'-methylthioadenosine deaminase [Methanocaldococcus sp. FS406-22]ADC69431.1 amidohydrolase [Methanocaldococcus sp. FS406-22]